jgi:hypothetical protein
VNRRPDSDDTLRALTADARAVEARSIETVRRAIEVLRFLIAVNRDLAQQPEHAATAQQRIIDGEIELATLESELEALTRGDVEGAIAVHEAFPAPPPR